MWELGYGEGVTGPTTPVGRPFAEESVCEQKYVAAMQEATAALNIDKTAVVIWPKSPGCQHTVIREGQRTLAILPTFTGDWERVGKLMVNAEEMQKLLLEAVYNITTHGTDLNDGVQIWLSKAQRVLEATE